MTFHVVRTKKHEIHLRNDDDEDVISFEIKRDTMPATIMRTGPVQRPMRIDHARRVAEHEAKRLGWL